LNFIKKDMACNDFSNTKIEDSWVLTSEATWRSELVAFLFADIWLTCNAFNVCILYNLYMYNNVLIGHIFKFISFSYCFYFF